MRTLDHFLRDDPHNFSNLADQFTPFHRSISDTIISGGFSNRELNSSFTSIPLIITWEFRQVPPISIQNEFEL